MGLFQRQKWQIYTKYLAFNVKKNKRIENQRYMLEVQLHYIKNVFQLC